MSDPIEFTPREKQVALLVVAGRLNKEVAADVGIAEGTVKIHLHRIYSKLNFKEGNSRVRLCNWAKEHGSALFEVARRQDRLDRAA